MCVCVSPGVVGGGSMQHTDTAPAGHAAQGPPFVEVRGQGHPEMSLALPRVGLGEQGGGGGGERERERKKRKKDLKGGSGESFLDNLVFEPGVWGFLGLGLGSERPKVETPAPGSPLVALFCFKKKNIRMTRTST